ncbi:MAG: hypothetical protein QOG53_26 [Frankiales bacterium]|jgi:hypothetical protein|nr:hypothetical protein [Frankiales bacterium]
MDDPFGTSALRSRVLDAWRASAARFREDANAEEDLVRGGYRDRVLIELAANAADAAAAAGVAGRLRFELREDMLIVANTGAPLDAAGVEALSTLRASAKREPGGSVGRFGVGFAAVLAITDAPRVASRSGGVRWSADETRTRIRELSGGVADEMARRADGVPVLRLPFPDHALPETEWDTVVALPLRDDTAEELVRRLLTDLDAALLLTLPALSTIEIVVDGAIRVMHARRDGEDVVIDEDGEATRWRVVTTTGRVHPHLLSDRPIEERSQSEYAVTWAVPVDVTGRPSLLPSSMPAVVHAPTPTDESVQLPVLLIATLPLDPTRRHVAPGPLTDHLVRAAASLYAQLLQRLPADPAVLDLVPQGLPGSEIDAQLRRAIAEVLPDKPFLGPDRLRPRDAVVADAPAGAIDVLDDVIGGLLPSEWSGRQAVLAVLGVRLLSLADLSDALGGLDRPSSWWRELYDGLASGHLGGPERDALGTLPVPLADGRLVVGPRGVLVPTDDVPGETLVALGLRAVDPGAAHDVLVLLGAVEATPRAVLEDPVVREAVARSYDSDDPAPLADAVLGLIGAAQLRPGDMPWLGDLALTGRDGEVYAASELLLPGSPLADIAMDDAPFGVIADDLVERWGADVLAAAGALTTFAMVREHDALGPAHDLDGDEDWWATLPAGASVPDMVAVRDLELVDPTRWDDALDLLATPPLRDAIVEPVLVEIEGRRMSVRSYAAWWLSRHPVLGGREPRELALSDELTGLYDAAPQRFDAAFLRAIGVRVSVDDLVADREGVADLLDRLADSSRTVTRSMLSIVHAAIASSEVAREAPAPDAVRAVRVDEIAVVRANTAVIVDAPDLLPLVGSRAVVPVPLSLAADLADVLAVSTASELGAYRVVSKGSKQDDHLLHDELLVEDADGARIRVPWRLVDGELHIDAVNTPFGLGRGRAWQSGEWSRRHLLTELLDRPYAQAELLAESDLDG